MSKDLLIETQSFRPVGAITESRGGGSPMVEGILATAEVKNGNGRYYPKSIWKERLISIWIMFVITVQPVN